MSNPMRSCVQELRGIKFVPSSWVSSWLLSVGLCMSLSFHSSFYLVGVGTSDLTL